MTVMHRSLAAIRWGLSKIMLFAALQKLSARRTPTAYSLSRGVKPATGHEAASRPIVT